MRKMTPHTIASLPRMSATTLSEILLSHSTSNLDAPSAPPNLAIIDVRDDGPSFCPPFPLHDDPQTRLSD
jgi:Cdc25 family phosphatase